MVGSVGLFLRGPPDVSSLVPLGPKYTVKWCHPLVQTEVVEAGRDAADSRDGVGTARGHSSSSSCTGSPGRDQNLATRGEYAESDVDFVPL